MSLFIFFLSAYPANTEYSRIFAGVMSSEYLREIFREYSLNIATLIRIFAAVMSSEYLRKIFKECFSYYVQRIFTRNIPRIFPEHCHTDTNIRSGNVQRIFTKNIQGMFFVNIRWTLPLRIFVNISISVAMFREYSLNISRKYSLDITHANIHGIPLQVRG